MSVEFPQFFIFCFPLHEMPRPSSPRPLKADRLPLNGCSDPSNP